jgi:MYXO-CTERM domain-containing protein
MFLLNLLISPAFACPTIATGTPSELSFDTAQVAIARQGNRTTFSVSINPLGEPQDFALVLPVPEILKENEIKTLDPEIFAYFDAYSAPRRVDDAGCPVDYDADGAGGDGGGGSDDTGGVGVEAEYLIGEYQIVILSAEESGSLGEWLDANGYYLPEGADERLQEYIDIGSYFLAAKVAEEAAVASGEALSPLQVSYDSEAFYIPIRLATLNSPGVQNMVIYALTDLNGGGRAGISNYTEFEVPDRCIWLNDADDFNAFYDQQFTEAWQELDDAGWTVEFAGTYYDCNPCTGVYISPEQVAELGFDESAGDHHLTRIKMRYTPEQAVQDLMLYSSGIYEPEVTAFADDNSLNRKCVDACDGSFTAEDGDDTGPDDDNGDDGSGDGGSGDGGSGDDGSGDDGSGDDGSGDGGVDSATADTGAAADGGEAKGCGCASTSGGGGAGLMVLLLGLVGAMGRRRS